MKAISPILLSLLAVSCGPEAFKLNSGLPITTLLPMGGGTVTDLDGGPIDSGINDAGSIDAGIDSGVIDAGQPGSQPTLTKATGPIPLNTAPFGVYGVSNAAVVIADLIQGIPQAVSFSVMDSTTAMLVQLTSNAESNIILANTTVQAKAGQPQLVLLQLLHKKALLTAENSVQLKLKPLAFLEQSGGGFEPIVAAPVTLHLLPFDAQLVLPGNPAANDDTLGFLVELSLTGMGPNSSVNIGTCGQNNAPIDGTTYPVRAGKKETIQYFASTLKVCALATGEVDIDAHAIGRFARFVESGMRIFEAVPLLDTHTGTGGWKGATAPNQQLQISLSDLVGNSEVDSVLVQLDAEGSGEVSAGSCSNMNTIFQAENGTHWLSLPGGRTDFCIKTKNSNHLRAAIVSANKKGKFTLSMCSPAPVATTCNQTSILGKLNCLPGVTATVHVPTNRPIPFGTEMYLLKIEQPVDHLNLTGPTFQQQVILTYRSTQLPVVLHTTGYTLFDFQSDLASHFDVNELEVEHRYFAESTPANADWKYMNITQSAFDSHVIAERLKPLFQSPWVSTGHSKGGMTAVYHRRFFPCDVAGAAPYVAPISYGIEDQRYVANNTNIGGPTFNTCLNAFRDIDRHLITNRTRLAPTLRGTYVHIQGKENALWSATGTWAWSMFQYGKQNDPMRGCPAYIALRNNPQWLQYADQFAEYGEGVSDQNLAMSGPTDELFGYQFQTQNELGSPAYFYDRNFLSSIAPVPMLPNVTPFGFGNVPVPNFEPRAMPDVANWLSKSGQKMLFVYGEFDPWSGGQFDLGTATQSLKVIAPGGSHGAGLSNLAPADKAAAYLMLEGWLGVPRNAASFRAQSEGFGFRDLMEREGI
jgi:hypothetical protein